MIKAIKVLYAVNIALFTLLIPLSFFCMFQVFDAYSANAAAQSEGAEVVGAIVATMFFMIFVFILVMFFIVADIISLILAIIGLVKINKATCKKKMKAIAIVQIIFLGNIVPAIMCLAAKEEEYIKEINNE